MTTTIGAGQVFSGVVSSGQTVVIASGGLASFALVTEGGLLQVASGGSAVSTTVSGVVYLQVSDEVPFAYGPLPTPATLTVAAGGVVSGTLVTTGAVLSNGGMASGTVVQGSFVASGGSAVDTVVAGNLYITGSATAVRTVVTGVLYVDGSATAMGTVVAGGALSIAGNATAVGTTVNGGGFTNNASAAGTIISSGSEDLYGTDTGTVVSSGGRLTVYGSSSYAGSGSGGISVSGVFLPGAIVSGASLTTPPTPETARFISATVEGHDGLVGGTATGTTLQPGTYYDDMALPFVPGATATLDPATDVLTISQGGTSTTLQLAGSYAGDTIRLEADRASGAPGTPGTLIEVTSGGQANGAFGFDKASNGMNSPDLSKVSTIVSPDPLNLAVTFATSAYNAVSSAGAGGTTPGVYAAALDGAGDKAIFATIDSAPQPLTATGTGRSVIAAGAATNTVTVSNGQDQVATGTGSSTVYLVTGSNELYSLGHDTVFVGAGDDTISISAQAVLYGGNANLSIETEGAAQVTLHTGVGTVQAYGGTGFGTFSGGTNGGNFLLGFTGPTTLYAGGNADRLVAQGGSSTTMYGWGGHETMLGQYSQGLDTFNFNSANVDATGGAGQNVFNIGAGRNNIVAGSGTGLFNVTNGAAGGGTFIAGFDTAHDHIHLAGYAADEVAHALGTATTYQGAEILHLRDGTTLGFGGVTGLTQGSFV